MRRSIAVLGAAVSAGLVAGALIGAAPAGAHRAGRIHIGYIDAGLGAAHLRAGPSPAALLMGIKPLGSRVTLICRTTGVLVHGAQRTTAQWDRLAYGYYVSDAYVRRRASPPPVCTDPPPAALASGWLAPVVAPIGDGFRTRGRPTHQGVDLIAARHTPILATAAGVVVTVRCNAATNNCDVDGGVTVMGCGWYVEVQHADEVVTRYCHMGQRPLVIVGQPVAAGQVLGYVGSSGHSSGPHLHFEVHIGPRPAKPANAVDPVSFMAALGAPLGRR
jgi:murein DD-endopeptidase MepM/ murein hydrolase activator NlpD